MPDKLDPKTMCSTLCRSLLNDSLKKHTPKALEKDFITIKQERIEDNEAWWDTIDWFFTEEYPNIYDWRW